jgi:hypothetical protein
MMMILAMTVPRLKPAMEARRIREAARAVHLYFASARATAMATGRPVGVMIERLAAEPRCSMNLGMVEVPPAYAGDTLTAVALVSASTAAGMVQAALYDDPISTTPSVLPAVPIFQGDFLQFNGQGPLYVITGPCDAKGQVTGMTLTAWYDTTQGQILPWPATANVPTDAAKQQRVPYKIIRRPVKSGVTPLQLPVGAAIDLVCSGPNPTIITPTVRHNMVRVPPENDKLPIMVMFSPTGAMERFYYEGVSTPMWEPMYLLIGRRDKVGQPVTVITDNSANANNNFDCDANIEDPGNLWVAMNPFSGLTTTAEVKAPPQLNDWKTYMFNSRDYARSSDMMGGR